MLHSQELIKIAKWFEDNWIGNFWVSFAKGFEDTYVIVEQERGSADGRQVFALSEILRGE